MTPDEARQLLHQLEDLTTSVESIALGLERIGDTLAAQAAGREWGTPPAELSLERQPTIPDWVGGTKGE